MGRIADEEQSRTKKRAEIDRRWSAKKTRETRSSIDNRDRVGYGETRIFQVVTVRQLRTVHLNVIQPFNRTGSNAPTDYYCAKLFQLTDVNHIARPRIITIWISFRLVDVFAEYNSIFFSACKIQSCLLKLYSVQKAMKYLHLCLYLVDLIRVTWFRVYTRTKVLNTKSIR